jgi:hypothetical protein
MDDEERKREIRKQKALDRLGSNHPCCAICGEDDWRVLELHHVAGKAYDGLLVPVCRNCHRKASDNPKGHPAEHGSEPPSLEKRLAHFLSGLADFLILLAKRLKEFSKELFANAHGDSKTEEPRA